MTEELSKINEIQLVVFQLANEEYGIYILKVKEIVNIIEITHIPGMPDFIEGIINLRGEIIPIIDLRKRFELQQKEKDEKTRIVIVEVEVASIDKQKKQNIGLIVDSVSGVIRLSRDQINEIPSTISQIDIEYLSGVVKFGERLIILLDLTKTLSDLEKFSLSKISKKVESIEKVK